MKFDVTFEEKNQDFAVDFGEIQFVGGGGGGIAKETDPTVPAWAKQPQKPTYTAEEVGAQPKGDYVLRNELPKIPETLPNPHKLTFTGAVIAEYDGSKEVEVEIPEGGSGGIPIPETAEVGQTIVVKAVDENGKPTEWECAELPNGVSDEQVASSVNNWLDEHPEATTTVADDSVTPNKTTFFKKTKVYGNLYDRDNSVEKQKVHCVKGETTEALKYYACPPFPVESGEVYFIGTVAGGMGGGMNSPADWAFYDADMNFIKQASAPTEYGAWNPIPDGVAYMRVSPIYWAARNALMVVKGTTETPKTYVSHADSLVSDMGWEDSELREAILNDAAEYIEPRLRIDGTQINSHSITNDKLCNFEYFGVENGGALTTVADGRTGTTSIEFVFSSGDVQSGQWFYGNTSSNMFGIRRGGDYLGVSVNNGSDYKQITIPNYKPNTLVHIVAVYDAENAVKSVYYNGELIGENADIATSGACTKLVDTFNYSDELKLYQKRVWDRVLTVDEVSALYNHGYSTKYSMPSSLAVGLISELQQSGIGRDGWHDSASNTTIAYGDGAALLQEDRNNPYESLRTLVDDFENRTVNNVEVVTQVTHPPFEVVNVKRARHDATFIGEHFVSFSKPSDGYAVFIKADTMTYDVQKKIDFYEPSTTRELEMKSCDYRFGKLIVGSGRSIKYGEATYEEQGAKLYVFHNADTWKDATETITLDNCGAYDIVDVSELGYKTYGFWGQFDNCVYVSCNLFNDVYLIQLGTGANNFGNGTYVEAADGRYNGSYAILGHWHQDGHLGVYAAHGGQYYKGSLYLADNNGAGCKVYKCILCKSGELEFEELNFEIRSSDNSTLKYVNIDGICIKDGTLYAQPLYTGDGASTNDIIMADI